jgi:transcriptional regulator with XRE-family HTH domain
LLRFRREATGLDRSQIAAGIGLTLTDVVMIESGQAEAALRRLRRLSESRQRRSTARRLDFWSKGVAFILRPVLTAHYFAWLDRIEAWPAEAREFQIAAARAGERFNDV